MNFGISKQVKLSNTGLELYSFGSQVAHLTDSGELFTDNTIRTRESFKFDVAQKRLQFFTNSTYITDEASGRLAFRCANGYAFPDTPTATIDQIYGQDLLGNLVKSSYSSLSNNYVDKTTNQTGIGGNKTWTGWQDYSVGGATLSLFKNNGEINYTNDLFLQYRTGKGISIGGNTGSGVPSFLNIFGKLKVTDVPTGTQQYLLAVDSSGNVIQGSGGGSSPTKVSKSITIASGSNLTVAVSQTGMLDTHVVSLNLKTAVPSLNIHHIQPLAGQFVITYSSGFAGSVDIQYIYQ